uniref:Ovule protein n=1 Tax=Taenia asiatica TaxID=60517 RepID=A0A0R3W3U9_TAEAS
LSRAEKGNRVGGWAGKGTVEKTCYKQDLNQHEVPVRRVRGRGAEREDECVKSHHRQHQNKTRQLSGGVERSTHKTPLFNVVDQKRRFGYTQEVSCRRLLRHETLQNTLGGRGEEIGEIN